MFETRNISIDEDETQLIQLQEKIEQQLTTLALASPQDQQDKTKK